MFWFLLIMLVITFAIAYSAESKSERINKENGISEVGRFEYCGGNDKIVENCKVWLFWFFKGDFLMVKYSTGLHPVQEIIPYDKIIKVSGKTETQIKSDVTLTRLALFGIFAFGMKKERKESNYFLVLEYINEDGENQKVILSGITQSQLNSYNSLLKEYRARKEAEELAQIEAELAELEKEEAKN